jgi:hypothetical protein
MGSSVLLVIVLSVVAPFAFIGWLLAGSSRNRRLLRTGVPAVATILGVAESNVFVHNRPVLRFALRVEAPGAAPYDTEASTVVPFSAMGLIRPGARVGVRVDPSQPTKVAIDLSQLSVTAA